MHSFTILFKNNIPSNMIRFYTPLRNPYYMGYSAFMHLFVFLHIDTCVQKKGTGLTDALNNISCAILFNFYFLNLRPSAINLLLTV